MELGARNLHCYEGVMRASTASTATETSVLNSLCFDVTVRIGCSLAYQAMGNAWLFLNLKPAADRNHSTVSEAITLGNNLPLDEFDDSTAIIFTASSSRRGPTTSGMTRSFRSRPSRIITIFRIRRRFLPVSCRRNYCVTRFRAGTAILTS